MVAVMTAAAGACGGKGPETHVGQILTVETQSDQITSMEMLVDGKDVRYKVTLDADAYVSREHLLEHAAQSWPVKIFLRGEGAASYVYRIEDAPQ